MKGGEFIWLDGRIMRTEEANVPLTSHALHYGTTVFEGIRGYWNGENLNLFRLADHLARLRRSGTYYSMRMPYTIDETRAAIIELCRRNSFRTNTYLRPFYFVGDFGIRLDVNPKTPVHMGIIAFPFGDLFSKGGISAGISSWRKFSDAAAPPMAKMGGNYLGAILATQEAKRAGYDEAILLDSSGNISEAPGENIFVVQNGRLSTPPQGSSPLDGLTRDAIVRLARAEGYDVEYRIITRGEMRVADEIFLTGTAAEVIPVVSLDGFMVGDGRPGDMTARLCSLFEDVVMARNPDYSKWLEAVYL